MTAEMSSGPGKRTQIDRLADKALEDLEDAGLEHATPEQHALALQAAVYRELRNGGGRIIVVPMRVAFAFGAGTASGVASTVVGAVKALGGA
ncbi:MAG: hypothetical protein QGI33_05705 [Candidatus Brocadiia bacterium]|nr:hypothetical protein [Candidatus Brocadiia bacterium]